MIWFAIASFKPDSVKVSTAPYVVPASFVMYARKKYVCPSAKSVTDWLNVASVSVAVIF